MRNGKSVTPDMEGDAIGGSINLVSKRAFDLSERVFKFNLGGAYLSSQQHPQGYPVAEKIVKEFALTVSKGLVEEELKAEMKKLKDIEDQKKDLAKDKGRLEKDIEGYKKDIEECIHAARCVTPPSTHAHPRDVLS